MAPPDGTGAVDFNGETGRARNDFAGEVGVGLIGERGRDREFEFAERGERTCDGWRLAREVVREGGSGGPRGRFLGFERSSFSLSGSISSLYFVSRALWQGIGRCTSFVLGRVGQTETRVNAVEFLGLGPWMAI